MSESAVLVELPKEIAAADNLPSPPTVALEILRLMEDENCAIPDLAQTISGDPALAAKILKLANSAMFRRGDEVTTIDRAAVLIGLRTLKVMALSFSLTSDVPRGGVQGGFDYAAYWRRSVVTATAARSFARRMKSAFGEELFLCGLLARIGQLVMAQCIPDEYGKVLAQSQTTLPSAGAERTVLGYDYRTVAESLLQSWGVPQLIARTVGGRPCPPADGEEDADPRLPAMLRLGECTAEVLLDPGDGASLAELQRLAVELLGVAEDEVDAVIVDLEGSVAEMAEMLDVEVPSGGFQELLDRARTAIVQVSLDTTLDLRVAESRAEQLELKTRDLYDKANTDKLTGIPNRAAFDDRLEHCIAKCREANSDCPFGVLMLDVDHFKGFNDTYGHQVGDQVLQLVAKAVHAATRETDFAARYGGEEFAVIVPSIANDDLHAVAERIRERVAAATFTHEGQTLAVTISVGGACVRGLRGADDGKALLARADQCLYDAKAAGRNRSVCRDVS